jgi:hypothetical protein
MINRAASRLPIASFTIPPAAPAPVAEAYAHFDRVAEAYGRLRGDLDDAKAELVAAARGSVRAAADAIAAGKPLKDPDKPRRDAEAKIANLQRQAEAASIAVDEAGNEFADAIAEHRGEWLEELAAAEQDAAARYDRAIAEARRAVDALGPARRALAWLRDFDAGRAHVGQEQPFHGGRVRVDTMPIRRETSTDPCVLLDVLATATATPEPAKPRKHAVAVR